MKNLPFGERAGIVSLLLLSGSMSIAFAQSSSSGAAPDGGMPALPARVEIEPEGVDPALFFGTSPPTSQSYRLGPEDVLEVRVFEIEELNRTVRVSGDGRIDLPLVGALPVQGRTADELSELIAAELGDRYVENPQVSVFIQDFQSQKVSLLGAVKQAGAYPLSGFRNLLQLFAEAGGLTPEAGRVVYLFRQTGNGATARLTVPLNELLVNGDPRLNIALRAGDVVSVPPAEAIGVSVIGAVNSPGLYKLPPGDEGTLLKAIALAGGLSERASKGGVRIRRTDPGGREHVVKVDFKGILSGRKPDLVLQEGDVIVVKESFF